MTKPELLNKLIDIWREKEFVRKQIDKALKKEAELIDKLKKHKKTVKKASSNLIFSGMWMVTYQACAIGCVVAMLFAGIPALIPSFILGAAGCVGACIYNRKMYIEYFCQYYELIEQTDVIVQEAQDADELSEELIGKLKSLDEQEKEINKLLNQDGELQEQQDRSLLQQTQTIPATNTKNNEVIK